MEWLLTVNGGLTVPRSDTENVSECWGQESMLGGPAGGRQPASEAMMSLAGIVNLMVIKIIKSTDSGVRLSGHTGLSLLSATHQL